MKKCCKNNRLEEGTRVANEPNDFELFFSLSLSLSLSLRFDKHFQLSNVRLLISV